MLCVCGLCTVCALCACVDCAQSVCVDCTQSVCCVCVDCAQSVLCVAGVSSGVFVAVSPLSSQLQVFQAVLLLQAAYCPLQFEVFQAVLFLRVVRLRFQFQVFETMFLLRFPRCPLLKLHSFQAVLLSLLFQDLSYKDKHWHEFCFKCSQCEKSLVDQPFAPKNEKIFCSDCYDNSFAARCDGCGNPFRGGEH